MTAFVTWELSLCLIKNTAKAWTGIHLSSPRSSTAGQGEQRSGRLNLIRSLALPELILPARRSPGNGDTPGAEACKPPGRGGAHSSQPGGASPRTPVDRLHTTAEHRGHSESA